MRPASDMARREVSPLLGVAIAKTIVREPFARTLTIGVSENPRGMSEGGGSTGENWGTSNGARHKCRALRLTGTRDACPYQMDHISESFLRRA